MRVVDCELVEVLGGSGDVRLGYQQAGAIGQQTLAVYEELGSVAERYAVRLAQAQAGKRALADAVLDLDGALENEAADVQPSPFDVKHESRPPPRQPRR